MTDFKLEAARAALKVIVKGQAIGLGAGSTIAHLVKMIAEDKELASSLVFTSSSLLTTHLLIKCRLKVQSPSFLKRLDIYFDGCDQFDPELNAFKSGGGIHTSEKILAAMASEFILLGDAGKFANQLDNRHPLVIEILPQAFESVLKRLQLHFPDAALELRVGSQKDGAVISDHGNFLVDVRFKELMPLENLNSFVKMIPGVVDHSLFYRMASRAIIAGEKGIQILLPLYQSK